MEPSAVDVEGLLRSLSSGILPYRLSAIRSLGQLPTSSEQVVHALITARETDAHPQVRSAATEALFAPVHQAFIQAHPDFVNATVAQAQAMAQQQDRVPVGPLSWRETWSMALFRPSVSTFERISLDPDASVGKAVSRVWSATFVSFVIVLLIAVWKVLSDYGETGQILRVLCSFEFIKSLGILALYALAIVLGFLLNGAITHLVARVFGGSGTYSRLVYTNAAFWAPLMAVSVFVSLFSLSWGGYVALALSIYQLVLGVLVVKAVHQFSWVKAIATVLLAYAILIGLIILLAWALSGGDFSIKEFFENIIDSLGL